MKILMVVGGIVLGFAAWALGLAAIVMAGNRKLKRSMICTNFSYVACLAGLALQYYDLVNQVEAKNTAAITGSLHVIWVVILVIAGLTVVLNLFAGLLRLVRKPKKESAAEEKPGVPEKPASVPSIKPSSAAPTEPACATPSMADSAAAKLERTED